MRLVGIVVIGLGLILGALTVPFLGGGGMVTKTEKFTDGRVTERVTETDTYREVRTYDPAVKGLGDPVVERDERSFVGMLGAKPPHWPYQALAGALAVAGLALLLRPWAWFTAPA